jgi:hypothetical protein
MLEPHLVRYCSGGWKFLEELSNSGAAVRRYSESRATTRPEGRYRIKERS